MKRNLLILSLATLLTLSSCGAPKSGGDTSSGDTSTSGEVVPAINSITLGKDKLFLDLVVNTSETIVVNVDAVGGAPEGVTFASSNKDVATVSNAGLVKAIGPGKATITVTSKFDKEKKATCEVEVATPTTYVVDASTITPDGDHKFKVDLKSAEGKVLHAGVVGATIVDSKLILDSEAFLYNTTPIEGIGASQFTLTTASSAQIRMSAFLSYNQLTMEGILDGKYQDLFSYISSFNFPINFSGTQQFTLDVEQFPDIANKRHFLVHLQTLSGSVELKTMYVGEANATLPKVDIGTNDGTFSKAELELFKTHTNNSLPAFTKAGTGAYTMYTYYDTLYYDQLFKNDTTPLFIDKLAAAGFSKTYSQSAPGYGETAFYQKKDGSKVHTYQVMMEIGEYFTRLFATYGDNIGYIETSAEWPEEYLSENVEHFDDVEAWTSEKIDHFQYTSQIGDEYSQQRVTIILVYPKAGQSITSSDIDTYLSLYTSGPYTRDGNTLYHDDHLLRIDIENSPMMPGLVQVTLYEYPLIETAPTPATVAKSMGISQYKDKILTFSGGENAYYIYNRYSYFVFDADPDFADGVVAALTAAGYEEDGVRYYLYLDIFGSYISVEVTANEEIPNAYQVEYSYHDGRTVYQEKDTFREAINQFSYQFSSDVLDDVAEAVDGSQGYTYYANGTKVIILGAGAEMISKLKSVSGMTYVKYSDNFYPEGELERGFHLEFYEDGVVIDTRYSPIHEYTDYTVFNESMEDFAPRNELLFFLNEDDELEETFFGGGSYLYYDGTLQDVEHLQEVLIEKIEENDCYVYSTYYGGYFDKDAVEAEQPAFVVSFYIEKLDYKDNYTLCIRVETNINYYDYDSLNHLLPSKALSFLAIYPALPFGLDDEVAIFASYQPDEGDVNTVYFNAQIIDEWDDYAATLEENGFFILERDSDNGIVKYYKNIGGELYTVTVLTTGDGDVRYIFEHLGAFSTAASAYADLDFDSHKEFLDIFNFTGVFDSASNDCLLLGTSDNYAFMYTLDTDGVADLKTFLLAADFEYNTDNKAYYYHNSTYDLWYRVAIVEYEGGLVGITFEEYDYTENTMAWSGVKDCMDYYNYPYDEVKDKVPHPVFDEESGVKYYLYVDADLHRFRTSVLKSFDMETYIATLRTESYMYEVTGENEITYHFDDGIVRVHECEYYYELYIELNIN